MPLNFHVNAGPKTRDSIGGQEKYATDPNAASTPGQGHFTTGEKVLLARHEQRRMFRYKDESAYFCSACRNVYNVKCPRCGCKSPVVHTSEGESMFVAVPDEYDRYEGFIWVQVNCKKCDFGFRVIKQ